MYITLLQKTFVFHVVQEIHYREVQTSVAASSGNSSTIIIVKRLKITRKPLCKHRDKSFDIRVSKVTTKE